MVGLKLIWWCFVGAKFLSGVADSGSVAAAKGFGSSGGLIGGVVCS